MIILSWIKRPGFCTLVVKICVAVNMVVARTLDSVCKCK